MAITDAQKVDLLYKKIGFGVAKTDTSAFKSPSNEANASPLLTRGDTIWQLSDQIPTTIPAANTAVVALYKDSLTSTIQATLDSTVSGTNRTWLTNLRDWIPPEFGADYQVKVYADTNGSTTPQTTGTQLFADGSGNNDAWYFDYAAGILNFPDTNVPSAVSGKRIFVSGARYIGFKGVATFSNVAFGNITITGNIAGNVVGNVLTTDQPYITSLGNLTSLNVIGNLSAGNLIVGNVDLSGLTSNVITANAANISGNAVARWFLGNVQGPTGNFTTSVTSTMFYGNITAQSITSPTGDLHISAATNDPNNIIRFDSVSAFDIPSGTTAQRPPSPDYGYVRYNTDNGSIEWWSGVAWISGAQTIQTETITPDGVSITYTLNQSTTETGILVNVNGTIQQAGSGAYTVAGDQITFGEAPLATDIIEIRYLASGVAALTTNFGNIASNVVPYANITYSLGSTTNRWKDLWLSGSTIYLGDATLSSSNGAIQLPSGSTVGGANVDVNSINANVTAANINISTANQNIATINANITATNVAIVTANTGMKTYVDSGIANALFVAGSYGNVVVAEYLYFDPLINSVRANLGVTQIWANANIASTNANLGVTQIWANANIASINANLGAYQTYANANVATIQANIGEFYNYANTKIGTNTNSNLLVTATTTSTSNVTGALVVRGGVGISGNLNANGAVKLGQPGTTSNVVIVGTTASSGVTNGALVVRGGVGVSGAINSTSIATGTATIGTVLGSTVDASATLSLSTDSVVAKSFVGRVVQDNSITTTDVDLSGYFLGGTSTYNYVTLQVTGQYVANTAAPATQARLLKAWSAGVWKNSDTGFYTIEGEVLQHAVFNSDAANFPAGAVSAAKVFLTGSGTSSVLLRFTNRTTPAATSATYWSYKVEVQTV